MHLFYILCTGMFLAQDLPLTQVASWGQEPNNTSLIAGNYLYVGGHDFSLHAFDIITGTPQSEGCANFLEAMPTTDTPRFLGLAQSGTTLIGVGNDRVFLFDISDPGQPVAQTIVPWPDSISGFQQVGDRIFVASPSGMYALDFANPTVPLSLLSWSAGAQGTAATDQYFVAIQFMTASIYDISNPNAPVLVGTFNGNGVLAQPFLGPAFLNGTQLYATDDLGDLLVIDISDPIQPEYKSKNDEIGYVNQFISSGDDLYAASTRGFFRLNTETPNQIKWHDRYLPHNGIAASVSGDKAFVSIGQNKGFVSINLNPSALGNYKRQAFSDLFRAMAFNGNYVFSSLGESIGVTDFSDPSQPRRVSALHLGSQAEDLHLSGNTLIAVHNQELSIIDVTNPLSIQRIGHLFLGRGYSLDRSGDYVYISSFDEFLRVVDVSDPTQPQLISETTLPFRCYDVSISGDRLFVSGQGGLFFDISNPHSPILLASAPNSLIDFFDCTLVGDIGYAGFGGVFYIFDFRDPSNPVVTTSGSGETFTEILSNGTHLFASRRFDGLYVYDLSDPLLPTLTDAYSISHIFSMDLAGDEISLATVDLFLFDVSDPTDITLLGQQFPIFSDDIAALGPIQYLISTLEGFWIGERVGDTFIERGYVESGSYTRLATNGDALYAAHEFGIDIYDLTDPYAPTLASQIASDLADEIFLDNNRLYRGLDNEIAIYDLTNPLAPVEIASPAIANLGSPFQVVDNHLYTEEIKIYDLTDAANPILLGETTFDTNGRYMGVCGGHLFIDDGASLFVYDVSDPANPCFVSEDEALVIDDFACGTDYMFMARQGQGVYAMDLANLSRTFAVQTSGFHQAAEYLDISGDYLHAAGSTSVIIDISQLTSTYIDHRDKPDNPRSARDGSRLWLADATGVWLLDMSIPDNPQQIAHFDLPGIEQSIAIDGQYGYVGTSDKGIYSLDLSDPQNPVILDQFARNVGENTPSLVANDALHVVKGIRIYTIDVSDPNNLVALDETLVLVDIEDLLVGNGALYIMQPTNFVDIVEPGTLNFIHTMHFAHDHYNIAINGNHAWISKTNEGLDLYDISDPASPQHLANWAMDLSELAVDGDTLYLLDAAHTLQEWDVTNPALPESLNTLDIQAHGRLTAFSSSVVMTQAAPTVYVYASCLSLTELNYTLPNWPTTDLLSLVQMTNQLCE